jgi:hypothetical protein
MIENSTREKQRYYIWVCWKNGKGADDIHKELVIAEGDKALSKRLYTVGLKHLKLDN